MNCPYRYPGGVYCAPPLHLACGLGLELVVQCLVDSRADVNQKVCGVGWGGRVQMSTKRSVGWGGRVQMSTKRFVGWGGRLQMYVHSGVLWCGDPTSLPTSLQDTDSRCPIHVAISSRHPPCSAHLLVHPALNLTLKDRNGLTPFASALKHQDHHTGLAILTKGSEAAEQVGGAGGWGMLQDGWQGSQHSALPCSTTAMVATSCTMPSRRRMWSQ